MKTLTSFFFQVKSYSGFWDYWVYFEHTGTFVDSPPVRFFTVLDFDYRTAACYTRVCWTFIIKFCVLSIMCYFQHGPTRCWSVFWWVNNSLWQITFEQCFLKRKLLSLKLLVLFQHICNTKNNVSKRKHVRNWNWLWNCSNKPERFETVILWSNFLIRENVRFCLSDR